MSATSDTVKRVIPEALGDEDGERWCVFGHVEPGMAVLAVVFEQMVNVGAQAAYDLLVGGDTNYADNARPRRTLTDQQADADGLVECVTHVWMRENPENDDLLRCSEGDIGAEPWTLVDP